MIDEGRIASFQFPGFTKNVTLALRHNQNGRHPERMWRFEVARQILEHRGFRGIDAMAAKESLVNLRQRLRIKIGRGDVKNVLEVTMYI